MIFTVKLGSTKRKIVDAGRKTQTILLFSQKWRRKNNVYHTFQSF